MPFITHVCVAYYSDKHNAKVVGHMLDIMTPLIVESDAVSQDILDVILGNILEPFKVTLFFRWFALPCWPNIFLVLCITLSCMH